MATKKKSSKPETAAVLARKLKKVQAAHKKQHAVLKKIQGLLHAAERLVDSLSTPPPGTEF